MSSTTGLCYGRWTDAVSDWSMILNIDSSCQRLVHAVEDGLILSVTGPCCGRCTDPVSDWSMRLIRQTFIATLCIFSKYIYVILASGVYGLDLEQDILLRNHTKICGWTRLSQHVLCMLSVLHPLFLHSSLHVCIYTNNPGNFGSSS